MKLKGITQENLQDKKVLLREDFNVPLSSSKIVDDTRIQETLPSIKYLLEQNAKIGIMSHLGRPKPNVFEQKFSLLPIAQHLETLLNFPVKLTSSWDSELSSEYITLFENVRFLEGETSNDVELSKKMAGICDVFVMDAFATSHRAHASTCGVAKYAPVSLAGPLLIREIDALSKAILNPKKPIVAIIAGKKISSKLPLLKSLIAKIDVLLLGGAIVNTLLKAQGFNIGKSLYEKDLLDESKQLIDMYKDQIPLAEDVLVSKDIHNDQYPHPVNREDVLDDDIIGDIGPKTTVKYCDIIDKANTIIWNGPLGIFEVEHFARSTDIIAKKIASSSAFSIAGGGETISAITNAKVKGDISYISTGGGAFLSFLQDQNLPGLINLAKL